MDRKEALQELKAKLGPLDAYLRSRGIDIGADGKKYIHCLNPEHPDNNPSMQCLGANVYCHSCHATYDIINLMAAEKNMTSGQFIEWGYEYYNIPVDKKGAKKPAQESPSSIGNKAATVKPTNPPATQQEKPKVDYSADFEEWHKHIGETTYPQQQRGLTGVTISRFKIGYNANFKTYEEREDGTKEYGVIWQALIIPNGPYNFIARNTNPEVSKKNRYRFSPGTRPFFNLKALEQAEKPVFVVEGEIDALSIIEAGGEAIAIQTNEKGFLRGIENKQVKQPLLLALDKDEEGQKAEALLAAGLQEKGITFFQADITGEYKDANEAFLKDTARFIEAVYMAQQSIKAAETEAQEAEKAAYMGINAAANLEGFFNEIEQGKKPYSTGFPLLDNELGGGLFEGLTIIGAVTSAGKTTIAQQIVEYMAKETVTGAGITVAKEAHNVLIFSLETGMNELIARSISKETLLECFNKKLSTTNTLTTRDILNGKQGETKGLFKAACEAYKEYAKNVYIFQSLGKIGTQRIREEVENHKRITGKTPVVLIDYLQLLGQNETRYSMGTKEIMDAAVSELKKLAVDYKTPVILISSFNRTNYKEDANLSSFKESGGIEYSADLLLGLQYAGAGDKNWNQERLEQMAAESPRKMEMKILKQRLGGWSGRITFDYYAFGNYFRETGIKKKG